MLNSIKVVQLEGFQGREGFPTGPVLWMVLYGCTEELGQERSFKQGSLLMLSVYVYTQQLPTSWGV